FLTLRDGLVAAAAATTTTFTGRKRRNGKQRQGGNRQNLDHQSSAHRTLLEHVNPGLTLGKSRFIPEKSRFTSKKSWASESFFNDPRQRKIEARTKRDERCKSAIIRQTPTEYAETASAAAP
ncbi:hypothetical protein, partial [Mesorhizobium sp.]|uniref:hypothetical protein n=1 Tax=Mesorhizobium sp. TaxID=1871066 RepID=UPI0025DEE29D